MTSDMSRPFVISRTPSRRQYTSAVVPGGHLPTHTASAPDPRELLSLRAVEREIHSEAEDEGSFDFGQVRDGLSYAGRAIRRRPFVVLGPFGLAVAAAVFVAWAMPNRYFVDTKLLAPRPDIIAILANPGRSLGADSMANTRAVTEILRRDNVLTAIRQTGLLEHWRTTRPPVLRLKDRLLLGRAQNDEELTEILVTNLESRLVAWTEPQEDGSGSLTVGLTWTDPDMTVRLLSAILQSFLDSRQVNEIAIFGESITLLEERLGGARRELEGALAGARSAPARAAAPRMATVSPNASDTEAAVDRARLRTTIATKRRVLNDFVAYKERRVNELQTQLAELRAVYAESHPLVANAKRSLEALGADPPQILALRQEISEIEARFVARGGSPAELADAATSLGTTSGALPVLLAPIDRAGREPAEEYQRSRLTAAIARYYSLADRLEGARIERDAARASATFRYAVVRPPLPPRQPSNRMVKTAIRLGGALAGLLIGLVAAVGLEARAGRVVQRSQVERGLGLPVLAELAVSSRFRAGHPSP